MQNLITKLLNAQQKVMANKPKVGGFPYLAEVLRQAGITSNIWSSPPCQSIYVMKEGEVVQQGTPLVSGTEVIPKFDQEALIKALRTDQADESTFPEFLANIWKAGVTWYKVDFEKRNVIYGGINGKIYTEEYTKVDFTS